MSTLLEFSMSPMDKGPSLGRYVARSIEIVERSGLPFRLHAMGTILEGDFGQCMAVVQECYDRMRKDCARITCSIKIDYRQDGDGRIETKVASIERTLGRTFDSKKT